MPPALGFERGRGNAYVTPLRDNELQDSLQQLVNSELIFRRGNPPDATYTFNITEQNDVPHPGLDVIDRFATSTAALKDTGKDETKPTVVVLLGPEDALARARRRLDEALAALPAAGRPSSLVRYVEGLGEELLARLHGHKLEMADGGSGR